MSWWFHLLIRRVETLRGRLRERLRERCDVFERVIRAVGAPKFAARCEPLLVEITSKYSQDVVRRKNVCGICMSTSDLPAAICRWGTLDWGSGKHHHRPGKPVMISAAQKFVVWNDRTEYMDGESIYALLRANFK